MMPMIAWYPAAFYFESKYFFTILAQYNFVTVIGNSTVYTVNLFLLCILIKHKHVSVQES